MNAPTNALTKSDPHAPAAPSAVEAKTRQVLSFNHAWGRVCDVCNFRYRNHQEAQAALDDALDWLGADNDDDVAREIDQLHTILAEGSRQASRLDVAGAVAEMLAGFPNSSKAEMKLRSKLLADDLAGERLEILSLHILARAVRRKYRFMPVTAEVLAELAAARDSIERAWYIVEHLKQGVADARAIVERLRASHDAWLAKEVAAYKEALAVGGDLRRFIPEVTTAANPSADDVAF